MIAFEVKINGKDVCTAGVGEHGVLSAILSWVKRNSTNRPQDLPEELWAEEELEFSVGGLISHDKKDGHERVRWIDQSISVGDEIVIRILNQPACDEPYDRKRDDPNGERESKRRYYETLKAEFEGTEGERHQSG
jgi:hypothetical protein